MNEMLKQSLYLQWKIARWPLVPFLLAGFGLPLLALRQSYRSAAQADLNAAEAMLGSLQLWLPLFPLTAALLGFMLGLMAWSWDHRANHVYALSLPVARWEYALQKMIAGLAMLAIPIVAVFAGMMLGVATIEVPQGLVAYPLAFTARFALTALVVYAFCFALAAGTVKTVIRLASAFLFVLIFGTLAIDFVGDAFGYDGLLTPMDALDAAFSRWPGPFHLIGGNWMPIDV